MASAQKKSQVNTQVVVTGVAARYGRALHTLICEKKLNKKVLPQIKALQNALTEELQGFLAAATISLSAKENVLSAIGAKLKVEPVLQNFLKLVVQKKRAGLLLQMLAAVSQLEDRKNGVIYARVSSAVALSDVQEGALKSFVKKQVDGTVEVKLNTTVDETLLAGMRLEVGTTAYDSSLKNKLEQLKQGLHGTPL